MSTEQRIETQAVVDTKVRRIRGNRAKFTMEITMDHDAAAYIVASACADLGFVEPFNDIKRGGKEWESIVDLATARLAKRLTTDYLDSIQQGDLK